MIKRVIYAALAALLVLALAVGGAGPRVRASSAYQQKVYDVAPANLIAYWPLNELSGTTANDQSGNARNGAYSGVTLNSSIGPDLQPVGSWDGINDYANLYSASLSAAFPASEGTAAIWAKVADASVWSDSTFRYLFNFEADSSNKIAIYKSSTNNQVDIWRRADGISNIQSATITSVGWVHFALSWSVANSEFCAFVNGTQVGVTQTVLGAWAGSLSSTAVVIGARNTGQNYWPGFSSHMALWNVVLTPEQIATLADTSIPPTPTPTVSPSPTPDIYSYIALTSGQGARVAFEVNVGEIALALFILILLGLTIFGPLFLNMVNRR